LGPGPNNCPGILRGKDTIEGERRRRRRRRRGGGEEERRRGWERKRRRFGVRVVLDSKQRGQFKMSRLPNLQRGYHGIISPLLHNEIKCQWE